MEEKLTYGVLVAQLFKWQPLSTHIGNKLTNPNTKSIGHNSKESKI